MTAGADLIRLERIRQVQEESWDATHDDGHDDGELIGAAVTYALSVKNQERHPHSIIPAMTFWPHQWDDSWFKPDWDDPVRMLTKAGALLAAEIDRLQRVVTMKKTAT